MKLAFLLRPVGFSLLQAAKESCKNGTTSESAGIHALWGCVPAGDQKLWFHKEMGNQKKSDVTPYHTNFLFFLDSYLSIKIRENVKNCKMLF